ncbi:MAG TPA: DUF934 domain-containing protein [Usitatibacter sp.]|nr:DUF934 domain-containing protein [Usitatibacter sp.]
MSQVIRNRRVEDDLWQTLAGDATHIPAGPVIVPLGLWKARREELLAHRRPVGVWLAPEEEPAEIAGDLAHLSIVAVHFPKWGEGRGYSTAALLRRRFGWRGELRAFGELGRDHVFHLARVGFDSIRLGERHDPHAALAAFHDFSLRYQGSVDDPVPLFRKRAAGAGLQ